MYVVINYALLHTNNYRLKSEVSITLRCWLFSTCYTAVRFKDCLKSTSAIKIANTDDFRYEGKPSCYIAKSTLFAVSQDEWDFIIVLINSIQIIGSI